MMKTTVFIQSIYRALILCALAVGVQGCASVSTTGPLSIAQQGSFFVGGRNVKSDTLATLPQYAPGGTVTVGGAIKGDNVSLYVSDNGPGIAPEDMHNAFESFAAKGRAVSRGGAGLGLAIVNRFVELHHGWVELESDLGKGTRVTCHLPRNPRARREESREA